MRVSVDMYIWMYNNEKQGRTPKMIQVAIIQIWCLLKTICYSPQASDGVKISSPMILHLKIRWAYIISKVPLPRPPGDGIFFNLVKSRRHGVRPTNHSLSSLQECSKQFISENMVLANGNRLCRSRNDLIMSRLLSSSFPWCSQSLFQPFQSMFFHQTEV